MFKDKVQARRELAKVFTGSQLDVAVASLVPAIVPKPLGAAGSDDLGRSRIGGAPDLAEGHAWPIRPIPPDASVITELGGPTHGPFIERHVQKAQPYSFLGQFDLAEAAALGPVAKPLPSGGRLLFFYDAGAGPWMNVTNPGLVMWDSTPRERLVMLARPKALDELADSYRAEAAAAARQYKLDPPGPDQVPYWGPARTMKLEVEWRLPARDSLEAIFNTALAQARKNDDFADAYDALLDETWGYGHSPATHQLLGAPLPEQDDPRRQAAFRHRYGRVIMSLDEARRAKAEIAAVEGILRGGEWVLLAQFDNQDYLQQEFVEGTIYFVMRRDDLAARAFDKAVAVYQQT